MIKVYTRSNCPFCQKLIKLLSKENIDYENLDISKNPEIIKEIITRNEHTPVPQVEINGKIIFDYSNEEELVSEIKGLIE